MYTGLAIINRGIVGSGKSTFARMMKHKTSLVVDVHNTDTFHMVDGVYKFNFEMLEEYHKANLEAFKKSLKNESSIVICDNTNITSREYSPYVESAKNARYKVVSVVFIPDDIEVHIRRNVHNVPIDIIEKMKNNLLDNLRTFGADVSFIVNPHPMDGFENNLNFLVKRFL